MDSVNPNSSSYGFERPLSNCPVPVEGDEHLLEGVLRLSRSLAKHLAAHEPQRENLTRIEMLTEHLLRGDASASAVPYVRVLLCLTCRRLNAVHGQCFGRPLDRCLLLKGQVGESLIRSSIGYAPLALQPESTGN